MSVLYSMQMKRSKMYGPSQRALSRFLSLGRSSKAMPSSRESMWTDRMWSLPGGYSFIALVGGVCWPACVRTPSSPALGIQGQGCGLLPPHGAARDVRDTGHGYAIGQRRANPNISRM